jgi:hypothetical protein
MDFNEIATVSGKGGLFTVLAPTRGGMILESMDDQKKKMVVNVNTKVSLLGEISIYTTDADGAVPLDQIMRKVHSEFDGDTGLNGSSDAGELKSFLQFILPEYDEDRVYVSDIKKIVTWYAIINERFPELLTASEEESKKVEEKESDNSDKG